MRWINTRDKKRRSENITTKILKSVLTILTIIVLIILVIKAAHLSTKENVVSPPQVYEKKIEANNRTYIVKANLPIEEINDKTSEEYGQGKNDEMQNDIWYFKFRMAGSGYETDYSQFEIYGKPKNLADINISVIMPDGVNKSYVRNITLTSNGNGQFSVNADHHGFYDAGFGTLPVHPEEFDWDACALTAQQYNPKKSGYVCFYGKFCGCIS